MKKTKIAIVPGSFDPITYGHIDIVKRALLEYDKVFLAVMINSAKQYMFTLEERREIAKAALSKIENVEVISSDGMLWQLAKELGAAAIVKGYRNEQDLAYEEEMARYNLAHNPNAPTQLLQSSEKLVSLSSTAVRERILSGLSLTGYLPEKAIALIEKIRSERA